MQNIIIIFINETLIQYTNYKRSKTGLNRLTSTMFQLFWTYTSYLSYYHYQQQNMIPTLSYISSIFFIGLECNEILEIRREKLNNH
jgi:hypothetical protein